MPTFKQSQPTSFTTSPASLLTIIYLRIGRSIRTLEESSSPTQVSIEIAAFCFDLLGQEISSLVPLSTGQ